MGHGRRAWPEGGDTHLRKAGCSQSFTIPLGGAGSFPCKHKALVRQLGSPGRNQPPPPGHPPQDLGPEHPQCSPNASSSSAGRSSVSKKSLELHLVISLAKTSSLSDRSSAEAGGKRGWGDTPVHAPSSSDTLAPTQPVPRWCQYRGHRRIPLRSCSPSPGQCSASATLTGSEETRPLPPVVGQHSQPPAQRPSLLPHSSPLVLDPGPPGRSGPSLCHPEPLLGRSVTIPGTPRAPAQETQARQNSPLTHLLWRTAAFTA